MNVIHRKRVIHTYKLRFWSNGQVKRIVPVIVKARRGLVH